MEIAVIIIVSSLVWLSIGYYAGRKAYRESRRKGWNWGLEDEIFIAFYVLLGPIFLVMQVVAERRDEKPEPSKPREINSIFGRKDKS